MPENEEKHNNHEPQSVAQPRLLAGYFDYEASNPAEPFFDAIFTSDGFLSVGNDGRLVSSMNVPTVDEYGKLCKKCEIDLDGVQYVIGMIPILDTDAVIVVQDGDRAKVQTVDTDEFKLGGVITLRTTQGQIFLSYGVATEEALRQQFQKYFDDMASSN